MTISPPFFHLFSSLLSSFLLFLFPASLLFLPSFLLSFIFLREIPTLLPRLSRTHYEAKAETQTHGYSPASALECYEDLSAVESVFLPLMSQTALDSTFSPLG